MQHAFSKQLRIDPRECRILLTDPALNPKANRQRMMEVMFETFGFEGAFMQIQAVLTLYALGRCSTRTSHRITRTQVLTCCQYRTVLT